jgi:hypothetical protein
MSSFERNKKKIKDRLSEAQNHRCCFCGCHLSLDNPTGNSPKAATVNLIVPKSQGGTTEYDNLFIACLRCSKRRVGENALEWWEATRGIIPIKERTPPPKRKRWRSDKKLRVRLSEAQNHRCCYCSIEMQLDVPESHDYATIEHVTERGHGGSDKWENLVVCCTVCNGHRNDLRKDAQRYYEWVQKNGRMVSHIFRYLPAAMRKSDAIAPSQPPMGKLGKAELRENSLGFGLEQASLGLGPSTKNIGSFSVKFKLLNAIQWWKRSDFKRTSAVLGETNLGKFFKKLLWFVFNRKLKTNAQGGVWHL